MNVSLHSFVNKNDSKEISILKGQMNMSYPVLPSGRQWYDNDGFIIPLTI